MCKRINSDSPEWQNYVGGILINRIPDFAISGDIAPSGAKYDSEEYKQNRKDFEEKMDKSKPFLPLVINFFFPGLPLFINNDDQIDPKENRTDDKQTLSKIKFTGSKICNPCDLDGCTEWELTGGGGGGLSFGSKSSKKKNKDDSDKQSFGDKLAALFD